MVTILLPMEMQEMGVLSLSQKIPRIRTWQPTPVFLPGKSHGHRSLAGYTPWSLDGICVPVRRRMTHLAIKVGGILIPTET